jgi:hypothetical protein
MAITVERTGEGIRSVDYGDGIVREFDDAAAAFEAAERAAELERRGYILIERRPDWLRG